MPVLSRVDAPARRSALILLLAAVLTALPGLASAWSGYGHRLIAELAARRLSPEAQAAVAELLAGEPRPTLAGVAVWADEIRDEDAWKHTARWHYVNFPSGGCEYAPARDCPDGNCVVAAIERQLAILADRTRPHAQRARALKFVVHLIGDVHQPLHAGNRDDRGGNAFQVSLRTDLAPEAYARDRYVDGVQGTNLHAVWDYYLLASRRLTLPRYVALLDAVTDEPPSPAARASDWAQESCRSIETDGLYPRRPGKLSSAYLDAHRPLAEQRIRLAAARLADALNRTLGTP